MKTALLHLGKTAAEKSAAGDYAQTFGKGFDTYRNLWGQGYSKEEAAKRSLVNAGVSLAGEKVLDKGGKWLNKQLPKGNVYGLTAGTDEFVDRVDDILPELPKKSTIKLDIQFFAEKDLINQSSASLKKGIKSLEKEIKIHEAKLNNPENFDIGWNNKDNRAKEGLLKYWQKEIRNQKESIENRIEELRKRGEDYD